MYNTLLFFKFLLQESVSAVSEVIDVVTSEDVTAAVEAVQSGFYADMGMLWMLIAGILVFLYASWFYFS